MIVASNELSIFVHLPETIHLGITLDLASGFMPSQRLTEPGRPLGYHGSQRTLVSLPDSEANKCLFMIGSSRRGKSNSMIHQILYLAQTGNGVGFIDPHRTTAFEILELLPISLKDRVVWCDFDDLEYTVAYNPFDAADSYGRLAVEITNSFKNLFDATSFHRMTHLLGNTLHALFDLKRNLQTIPALIARTEEGEALRQQVIRQTQNSEIRRFWKEEFKTYPAEAFAPILNRHSSLFMDETAQRIFSQNGNKIEIDRIMNESKILIVALPASIDVAALIGGMLIAQTQKAALARIGKSASKNPFYLFIDEFHRFSTGRIIESIINETVKAGLHLCLANQETGQLNDELLKAVLSIPNIMVFNVNYLDARRLTSIFNDRVAIEDILSLKVGEVFARLDNDIIDFRCPAPLINRDSQTAWEMIEQSRRHYYVARQKPETKFSKRLRRDIDTF